MDQRFLKRQGGYSQNFLQQIIKFFVISTRILEAIKHKNRYCIIFINDSSKLS
jgi:hypothetical protein